MLAAHQTARTASGWPRSRRKASRRRSSNLRTFPFVTEAENKGRLSLHGAYFDIATGTLSVLNHSRNEFFPL